jgi:hypothetical protein
MLADGSISPQIAAVRKLDEAPAAAARMAPGASPGFNS